MPVKKRIQLRNISNVAASKTALLDIPCGDRYHLLEIQHGYTAGTNTIAAAATNITEIRVKVNGRVQRVISGTQLRDLNILNGTAYDCTGLPNTAPGVAFPIFFAEPWRMDEVDQDALAWKTNGWNSFQVEIDLGAAGTPTLVAWAVTDKTQASKVEGIVKWLRTQAAAAGTSFDIPTMDRKDWLQQISLYPDSGGANPATQVTFRVCGDIYHEMTMTANIALLNHNGMVPAGARTANIYDMVLDHDGLLATAVPLDGVKDVTLTIAAGGAMSGTVTAIIQRLGPPD